MDTLRRLLSPEYLIVNNAGPLGGMGVLYLALAVLFACGFGLAFWALFGPRRRARSAAARAWGWFELWVCLAGLAAIAGRWWGWPGWSARVWPLFWSFLALLGSAAYLWRRVRIPPSPADMLRILALVPSPPDPTAGGPVAQPSRKRRWVWLLLGALLHLGGVVLVASVRYHLPFWSGPLILAALLLPQAPLLARRGPLRWMPLGPLVGAYAAVLLWLVYRQGGLTVIGWQGLVFPNPMTSLFYVDGILLAATAWALLCQLALLADGVRRPSLLWRGAAALLLVGTLVWAGTVYLTKRTHGATASDPYAYAQMGVDLAQNGTFLHRYPLFQQVMPLQIAWAPLQPVGYHIPRNELGDCPSVWATGASVLLAIGFRLVGESGLYVVTPLVALLSLAATWALVQVALTGRPKAHRYLTAALTLALLATSPELLDRVLVPMADAPALLFTVLTLTFALHGMHRLRQERAAAGWFALAGFCFGWAYWVRHTQLVLALPVILALAVGSLRQPAPTSAPAAEAPVDAAVRRGPRGDRDPARRRWSAAAGALLAFGAASLLAALPDIIYRWRTFGGLLATETTELPLMAVQHIAPVAWQMLRDALVAGEWGYLFPLALYGGYRLARDRSDEAAVLGCAFAAVLVVHLTYQSLRLRDLISLFPLVDLAVAYGAIALVTRARNWSFERGAFARLSSALLPVGLVAWVLLSLGLSRWAMVDRLWRPGWASFGYMSAEQRAAFDRLAELTPAQAVIGASLNAGAVMLYGSRDAIRPYDSWTDEEWCIFTEAMSNRQRPIYLLDDGGLMADFISGLRGRYRLIPVAELAVPIFYAQGRQEGWLYRLEWAR